MHLIIPPIRACPHLNPIPQIIRPTQKVITQLRKVRRRRIVQTHHKQRPIHYIQTTRILPIRPHVLSQARPNLPVLCGEHTDSRFGELGDGSTVRVGDDGLQVAQDLTLGEERPILVVEDIEPVELAPSEDDDVRGFFAYLHATSSL